MAEFEIECNQCGAILDGDFYALMNSNARLAVDPCEKCMAAAKEEGYEERQNEE